MEALKCNLSGKTFRVVNGETLINAKIFVPFGAVWAHIRLQFDHSNEM